MLSVCVRGIPTHYSLKCRLAHTVDFNEVKYELLYEAIIFVLCILSNKAKIIMNDINPHVHLQ